VAGLYLLLFHSVLFHIVHPSLAARLRLVETNLNNTHIVEERSRLQTV
jgi:hypothetical protein